MNIVPLNDKVIVRRMDAAERSKGGIIIPDQAKEKPRLGKVLAVGEGKLMDDGRRSPMGIKEGDRVLFSAYAGNDVDLDGEKYLILNEAEILGIVR